MRFTARAGPQPPPPVGGADAGFQTENRRCARRGAVQGSKVASKRWFSTAALAASLAALPPRAAPAQQTPPPASPAPERDAPSTPESLVSRDLEQLRNTLTRAVPATQPQDENRIQQQRDEAAGRLLSRPSPAARDSLLKILQDPATSSDTRLAIARAIPDASDPDPRLVAALLPMLGSKPALHDAAARALARFGDHPDVRQALLAFAQDAKQPAPLRVSVIRALANIVDRPVADALYALLMDARQPLAIQSAAGDALALLAGQPRNGHDAQRWKQWHDANAAKVDVVWREDVLAARDASAERVGREQSGEIAALQAILEEQYRRADQAGRFELTNRLLNSSDARVRAAGVEKVQEALNNAATIPVEAPARLKELIGDGDPAVRLVAAQAIRQLNDPSALDPVLTQLAQETVAEVKVAQIRALELMGNPRAVPQLRVLLHDPSIKAAIAAAEALRSLAPKVREKDPELAGAIANELWTVGGQRASQAGGADFRAACIEAVGQLRSRALAGKLLGLLDLTEPERVRGAALRALGDLGEPGTAFRISQWIDEEPSADDRADAVEALGHTGAFAEVATTLYARMNPVQEQSEKVQDRAWGVFQSLLPTAGLTSLNEWASKLKDDPRRQKMVLLALNDKLQRDFLDDKLERSVRAQREQDLAFSRQNTGAVYMKLGDPAEAAALFTKAREYWQKKGEASQTTDQLAAQLLDAQLAARHYPEAVQFASDEIGADRSRQGIMGPHIRNYVETTVVQEGERKHDKEKLKDAAKLIAETAKMKWPLDQHYRDDLAEFKKQIDKDLASMP
ncbi:MAG: putative phosphohydrolase [Phycisphaerales bacterium]|nr:putative phosphohydrolase [Phycisphaerales bacterium]